jgi:uncharacterized protein (TIGR02569 family)
MVETMRPPPEHVLAAFAVEGEPVLLPGGTGRSWRVGSLVLKPLDHPANEIAWQAGILASVEQDGFRVARMRPQIVDGWIASGYVVGAHETGRWREIIAVGERLHAALAREPRPDAILDQRTDPWSIGDRVAWGEMPFSELDDILAALEPVEAGSQLIHGDLTGNVLFHDELPPAIIDVAPAWRPPAFASASVVAAALCWEGAPEELAGAVDRQYLLRALIFRAVTSRVFGVDRIPEIDFARRIARCASH